MFWLWKVFGFKERYYTKRVFQENRHWRYLIRNWQDKESKCKNNNVGGVPIYFDGTTNKAQAKRILKEVQKRIKYVSDIEQYNRANHFPTSEQVWSTSADDCDGQSVAVWKCLKLQCFPEDEIGMGIVKGHMFAVWHDKELINDFWVLDNGFLSKRMIKASVLFPCKYKGEILKPLYGFNVNKWWSYKKI